MLIWEFELSRDYDGSWFISLLSSKPKVPHTSHILWKMALRLSKFGRWDSTVFITGITIEAGDSIDLAWGLMEDMDCWMAIVEFVSVIETSPVEKALFIAFTAI